MKLCFLTLIFLPFITWAQHGPINIHLKSGEILSTRYAYLNSNGGFSRPFVRMDEKKGKKVPIHAVTFIEGIDQKGEYKYFKPIQLQGRQTWGERTFNAERMTIYYTNVISGTWAASYKSRHFQYSKDDLPLKKLTFANLKADLADNVNSMQHLKKGNTLRITQLLLYGLGAALIASGISSDFKDVDTGSPPGPRESSISIPPALIAGAVVLYIPWFINGPKQDHFTRALKSYK